MANKENLCPFPGSSPARFDQNLSIPTPLDAECTPPGQPSTPLGLRRQPNLAHSSPIVAIRPNSPSARNPALRDQRDHSACGKAKLVLTNVHGNGSPLRVRKTRENLRDVLGDNGVTAKHHVALPVPICACTSPHVAGDEGMADQVANMSGLSEATTRVTSEHVQTQIQPQSLIKRHKSVSRRMLSRVRSSVVGATLSQQLGWGTDGAIESNGLLRRLSSRRKASADILQGSSAPAANLEPARDSIDSAIRPYIEVNEIEVDECIRPGDSGDLRTMRSCTMSTTSSSGMLSVSPSDEEMRTVTPDMRFSTSSSPDPEPTPRAASSRSHTSVSQLEIPCVDLIVRSDSNAVEAREERDIWVAIVATIRTNSYDLLQERSRPAATSGFYPAGVINSLRLCFKPAESCRVLDIVGQKTLKDLAPGTTCSLFVKVRVYPVDSSKQNLNGLNSDQDSLFAELESMIGMLETGVLNVEARYRHSLFPPGNVVTIRSLAKVRRPQASSRWSQAGDTVEEFGVCWVHRQLMAYLRENYPYERASRLIVRALGHHIIGIEAAPSRHSFAAELENETQNNITRTPSSNISGISSRPTVVVTDIDSAISNPAPITKTRDHDSMAPIRHGNEQCAVPGTTPVAKDNVPTEKRTTALQTQASPLARSTPLLTTDTQDDGSEDTARALWRHIRRSSLSATAQLDECSAERLDVEDTVVGELRRKAIANKRSVGAETLKAWKWEGKVAGGTAVAPWL